jgi:hypothetical protein
MRPPRVRFTVRRLMIAVAVVGAASGLLQERSLRFRRKASYHRALSKTYVAPGGTYYDHGLSKVLNSQMYLNEIQHNGFMEGKYRYYSSHPWLPVPPDPPSPKPSPRGERYSGPPLLPVELPNLGGDEP